VDTVVDDEATVEVAPVVLGPETNVVVGIVLFVDGGGIAVVLETFALRPMAQVDKF
jgi:hypothetical protein